MKVRKIVTGIISTNSYVLSDNNSDCIIIDPSGECSDIFDYISENSLKPIAFLLTHGHFDHFTGIPFLEKKYGNLPIYAHKDEYELLESENYNGSYMLENPATLTEGISYIEEGELTVGQFHFQTFHVPGHSPGSLVYVSNGYCFSGDTLFAGTIGRTDFYKGNLELLVSGIKRKLLTLPDSTIVCPGHAGRTSIKREKRVNEFLR